MSNKKKEITSLERKLKIAIDALIMLAAQGSTDPLSTNKADCMAALAMAALSDLGQDG
jgi:hypothetical protein